jgi:hypothetical protein
MKVVRFVEVCATSAAIPFVVRYRFIDLPNETTQSIVPVSFACDLALAVFHFLSRTFSCHWIVESVSSNWSLTAVQFDFR